MTGGGLVAQAETVEGEGAFFNGLLVKVLREEGCNVLEKIDDSEYGKFA